MYIFVSRENGLRYSTCVKGGEPKYTGKSRSQQSFISQADTPQNYEFATRDGQNVDLQKQTLVCYFILAICMHARS